MDKGESHEINNYQGMGQNKYHHSLLTFILTGSYGSQHYNTNFQRNNLIVEIIMEVNVNVDLALQCQKLLKTTFNHHLHHDPQV
jgi:hypothetical protein